MAKRPRPAEKLASSELFHALRRHEEEAGIAAAAREQTERLEAAVETLARDLESRERGRVAGVSASWKDTLRQVGRVASSDTTVLLTGESGTGKEVISGLIHRNSKRAGRLFHAINCAALPEQLLESELFGHEKGAFTGANVTKIGRIEQAEGGTLFLDEIGELSLAVQAKFLRVLEQREFQRVGGNRTLKADVRVIAATNRDLGAAIARRAFREDLYYRLNVFQISIAPLRERRDDILPLAEVFLEDLGKTIGRPAAGLSREATEWLLAYHWPGNVRELRNAIERGILLCDGGLITSEHLPVAAHPAVAASRPIAASQAVGTPPAVVVPQAVRDSSGVNGWLDPAVPLPPEGVNLDSVERVFIQKALGQAKGNKSMAARLLGLTRAQLYFRLEKHGLA